MARNKSRNEIEIKLPVADRLTLRRTLKQLRASQVLPRTIESNTLYDTSSRNLASGGRLVRIRIEQAAAKGSKVVSIGSGSAILTYKGPSQALPGREKGLRERNDSKRFKIREEVEVNVSSAEQMGAILQAIGLRPTFRYEKFRTTYSLPGLRGLKIEFDETPVGLFIELEGSSDAIDRASQLLGYSHSDYMTESYGALYIADCRRRGKKPSNMLFQPQKKLR